MRHDDKGPDNQDADTDVGLWLQVALPTCLASHCVMEPAPKRPRNENENADPSPLYTASDEESWTWSDVQPWLDRQRLRRRLWRGSWKLVEQGQ